MQLTNQACGSWLRRRRERQLIHRFCSQLLFFSWTPLCVHSLLPSPRVTMFLPIENRLGPIGASNIALFYRAIPIPLSSSFLFFMTSSSEACYLRSCVFNFNLGVTRSREVQCVLHSVARFKKLIYRRFFYLLCRF